MSNNIGTTPEFDRALKQSKELQVAAQPLVDYLYKYGCPHSYILITQTSVELLSGECCAVFEPRD